MSHKRHQQKKKWPQRVIEIFNIRQIYYKQELEKNTVTNTEFRKKIEQTLTKAKLNDKDKAEILYERIVILEKENECLKNEVRNQKEKIKTLLTGETKSDG